MMEQVGVVQLHYLLLKSQNAGDGTQTAALAFGGGTTPPSGTITFEWTGAGALTTKTVTVS
jgi:hypothetical protein